MSARLIEATSGAQIWAERFDRTLVDLARRAGRDRRRMTLWTLAFAHWVAGDPSAAVPPAREAIAGRGGFVQRYGVLIAALVELGRLDEARELLAEAERVAPNCAKSRLEGKSWCTRPDLAARYAAALRKAAGLDRL